jgi:uncharacterized membrane protein
MTLAAATTEDSELRKELTMAETNVNSRIEAFRDGVFAVALTLLVIDIKVPSHEATGSTAATWFALQHLLPSVITFLLSFTIVFLHG